MAEVIKKHIESQMKLLATDRIKQLLERVQPGGFQTRAVVPGDLEDHHDQEETHLDISELCNWARLYFGDNMRPHFEPPDPATIEKRIKAANPLMKVSPTGKVEVVEVEGVASLDESTDDNFKERVRESRVPDNELQSALDPSKWDKDLVEWITWAQLTARPNNQRLRAVELVGELPKNVSRNPLDYDYLVEKGTVTRLREAQSRKEDNPKAKLPHTIMLPWKDLNTDQAAVARNLVSRALKTNPTIRDLAMHDYVIENGAVVGLESNPGGDIESMR